MAKSTEPRPCDGCRARPRVRGKGRRYCEECSIGCADHVAFKTGCNPCQRKRRSRPENKKKQLRFQRKVSYNLNESQLDHVESIESCEVCDGESRSTKLVVDHCHETGGYRGVICDPCNRALGCVRDNPDTLRRLADYLTDRKFYLNGERY